MAYPVTGEKLSSSIHAKEYTGGKTSNASEGRVMKEGSKTIDQLSNPKGRTSYVAGGLNAKTTSRGL